GKRLSPKNIAHRWRWQSAAPVIPGSGSSGRSAPEGWTAVSAAVVGQPFPVLDGSDLDVCCHLNQVIHCGVDHAELDDHSRGVFPDKRAEGAVDQLSFVVEGSLPIDIDNLRVARSVCR